MLTAKPTTPSAPEPDRTAAHAETIRDVLTLNGYPDPDTIPCPIVALAALVAENTRQAAAINDARIALRRWESSADDDEQFIMDALAALSAVAPPPPPPPTCEVCSARLDLGGACALDDCPHDVGDATASEVEASETSDQETT